MKYQAFAIYTTIFIGILFSCSESPYPDSMSPEESMNTFQLDDRFEIQLFAAEPIVKDPVSMIFDEKGDVYVVEMPDYPYKPEKGPGYGRIKKLLDTDGDGIIDDFVLFADRVTDATSVLPWKDGLLVTAAPDIWYMKDTDGDGQADEKERVFTGFFTQNQGTQITSLRFNVDNWIYACNMGREGEIQFLWDSESKPLNVSGADFRFRLDTREFEQEVAPGKFGQTFDNYGHRFVTHNDVHISEMVIPWRYLHRHPFMPSTKSITDISDHGRVMYQQTEAPYWRQMRTSRRQKNFDEQGLDRIEYLDNRFTSSSGGTYYSGHLFSGVFNQSVFTGEVSGNLVHQDKLVDNPKEVVFTAVRTADEQESEFLVSTDTWFRPTSFTVGPDGALYMIDFYRQHIETPLAITEDLKEGMDYTAGQELGRIYRIIPKGSENLSLDEVKKANSSGDFLKWLAHPDQWYRLQAHRVLLQRGDTSIMPSLEELAIDHSNGAVRLQALYLMDGLGGLSSNHVKKALADQEPGVRGHALRLAEYFPNLLPDVTALKTDPSARVRMQVALSLGEFSTTDNVIKTLGDILVADYQDPWIRMAVLSSDQGSSTKLLEYLKSNTDFIESMDENKEVFLHDFTYITAARGDESSILVLVSLLTGLPVEHQEKMWKGFAAGVKKSGEDLSEGVKSALSQIKETGNESLEKIISGILNN